MFENPWPPLPTPMLASEPYLVMYCPLFRNSSYCHVELLVWCSLDIVLYVIYRIY